MQYLHGQLPEQVRTIRTLQPDGIQLAQVDIAKIRISDKAVDW